MTIKNTHPSYDCYIDEFEMITDVFQGEKTIKSKTVQYLPAPQSMILDGFPNQNTEGSEAYNRYIQRAYVPTLLSDSVRKTVSIMHRNEASIVLPDSMMSLWDDADGRGTSLIRFLANINQHQLVTGRCMVVGDLQIDPVTKSVRPILKLYSAQTIRNWHINGTTNKPDFINLDETGPAMNPDMFEYVDKEQHRILRLIPNEAGKLVYATATSDSTNTDINTLSYRTPNFIGKTLSQIPCAFINAGDNYSSIGNLPLKGLSELVLSIYRADADYRLALHLQSQDTLVISAAKGFGDDAKSDDIRVGAGAVLRIGSNDSAEYIGVNSKGLAQMAANIANDYERASYASSQLQVQSRSSRDSAESLLVRTENMSAQYSTVAHAGANGLLTVLQAMAPWFNADPKAIEVEPNLDFSNGAIESKSFGELQAAVNIGFPLSKRSLHALANSRGITKLTYETELDEIENDQQDIL